MDNNYSLSPLLDKYDTVIFDLDGVLTSEQKYWDCVAMTLYQLFSDDFDVMYANRNVSIIRTVILYRDKLITLCKDLGVNSNWDLTYVIYAFSQIFGTYDTAEIYNGIKRLNLNALDMYRYIEDNSYVGGRNGDAYKYIVKLFNEWYLGEEYYHKLFCDSMSVNGKKRLGNCEEPLFDMEKTVLFLRRLSKHKKLGIATGRLYEETVLPLNNWGVADCFSKKHIATYSDVLKAEEETGVKPLTKPHPFLFLLGGLGSDYSYSDILNQRYDKHVLEKVLAVGDANADMLSAQNAGIDFAAVLTGIGGSAAREYFENNNAAYILDNVFDLIGD